MSEKPSDAALYLRAWRQEHPQKQREYNSRAIDKRRKFWWWGAMPPPALDKDFARYATLEQKAAAKT